MAGSASCCPFIGQTGTGVGLGLGDGDGVGLGLAVGDGVGLGVGVGEGLTVGEGVGLGSGEPVSMMAPAARSTATKRGPPTPSTAARDRKRCMGFPS